MKRSNEWRNIDTILKKDIATKYDDHCQQNQNDFVESIKNQEKQLVVLMLVTDKDTLELFNTYIFTFSDEENYTQVIVVNG